MASPPLTKAVVFYLVPEMLCNFLNPLLDLNVEVYVGQPASLNLPGYDLWRIIIAKEPAITAEAASRDHTIRYILLTDYVLLFRTG